MIVQRSGSTWLEPINLAAGKPCSIIDFLMTILVLDVNANAKFFNNLKPMMIPKRVMGISKAKAQIQFQAKVSLKESIRCTLV